MTLGFLRRNFYQYPLDIKEAAYKGLVCLVVQYGSCVCDPQGVVLQEETEKGSITGLIVLGFNDTSTLVGHFVSSPREREKTVLEEKVEEMKERNRQEIRK